MLPELARAWVDGWVVSRGTPPPVRTRWGLRIDVGLPQQVVRYVVPEPDEAGIRSLAAAIKAPATWIKTFLEPDVIAPWLPADHWTRDSLGWLMAVDLNPSAVRVPDGYEVAVETEGSVRRVRVLAGDGSTAARGQSASVNGFAVADQIVTELEHQRRGLGSVVMRTLANGALDDGATTGLLGASADGRALYEHLGWKVHAPLAGFVHRKVD